MTSRSRKPHLFLVAAEWFRRYFSDPEAIVLAVLIAVGFGIVLTFGRMLAPVIASLVIAYLLDGAVRALERRHLPRLHAVLLIYSAFMTFVLILAFAITPLLWTQLLELAREAPNYLTHAQDVLATLPERYPFISQGEINQLLQMARGELGEWGQRLIGLTLSSLPGVITLLVYLILVPLLVFFFLKDKASLTTWFTGFLPREHALAGQVWGEVDQQLGNYVRGKFWEILVVGGVSIVTFAVLGLKYAVLLGFLVGLSVIVPYIGAAVVTVPVALVAYFQWGWSSEFLWLMATYGVIQALDGNVLVPLLFSEVVNLHPVAIIVAVLVFGGLWGFWGVFFAIPLATLVSAIITAWPRPVPEEAVEG